jgi:predicted thioredoxin/glutaredoxin
VRIEIFTHKNCVECNILIDWLEQKGYLHKVKLIDTELYPFLAFERGVISTPSIFVDGKLVFAGVVDYDELEKLLEGEQVRIDVSKDELAAKFMEGIVNSFAATAYLYVNYDFDAILSQKDFVYAVTGLALSSNAESLYNYLRNYVIKSKEQLFEGWKERMKRVIAANFVRELYWLYREKLPAEKVKGLYPIEVFYHWVQVRGGAVGRVGLRIHPISDQEVMDRVKEVYGYLFQNYDALWDKVIKEQREIEAKGREIRREIEI